MQSIYKKLRVRFEFRAYRNKVGAEVFTLSYSNSYTSCQFWEASILPHAQPLHGVKHSFKYQHATAGTRSRKQSLSHFTLLGTKVLCKLPHHPVSWLTYFFDHTTEYSPQSPPSHSQSNYTHKSAFLDGVMEVNLYSLKGNCLKKFYTVYLKFLFYMSIYTHTHRRSNHAIYRCSWANGFLLHE